MPLPNIGEISINAIRREIGLPDESNFSLNTAEDGLYVTINPCSTFKPAIPDPAQLDEWWGYNHLQPCTSTEYTSVSCDTNIGICDVPFNTNQANSSIQMVPAHWMQPNGDGINDTWNIINANKFPNATFLVALYINNNVFKVVYNFTGTYIPWNAIGNVGEYNGIKVPRSPLYFFKIDYNDGSGRVIGQMALAGNNYLAIEYPLNGEVTKGNFSYSATSSALACASTSYETLSYYFPITTTGGLLPANAEWGDDYIFNKAGYYRLQGTTGNWIRINSSGEVMLDGSGNRIQGIC
jgi:gliding motility-associated-like protein